MDFYIIVIGKNLDDLQEKVNAEVLRGYLPQGGVYWQPMSYAQAMTLTGDKT